MRNEAVNSSACRSSLLIYFLAGGCGLKVTDAVVVMDREQGAVEMLASKGIRLHPIFSLFNLLKVLLASERIDEQMAQNVRTFILDNNTFRYLD